MNSAYQSDDSFFFMKASPDRTVIILIFLVYFVWAPIFVLGVLDPVFNRINCKAANYEPSICLHQLQDISRYVEESVKIRGMISEGFIDSLLNFDADRSVTIGFTNTAIYLLIYIGQIITPDFPQITVYLIQLAFLPIIYLMIDNLLDRWNVQDKYIVQSVCFLNPLFISAATGPTKEYWGFLFGILFPLLACNRRWVLLLILIPISGLFRDAILIHGLAIFFVFFTRIHAVSIWVGLSAVISAIDLLNLMPFYTIWRTNIAYWLKQSTAQLLGLAGFLQGVPLGLFAASFLIISIDVITPIAASDIFTGNGWGFWVFANYFSAGIFLFTFIAMLVKIKIVLRQWRTEAMQIFLCGVLVFTLAPVSQHRYLLPILPFAMILILQKVRPNKANTFYAIPAFLSLSRR